MKRTSVFLFSLIFFFIFPFLTSCSKEWKYNPITDVNNLEGRYVGVNVCWICDYKLTPRKDLHLLRYDTTADLVLALKYNKIDAIAQDDISFTLMKSQCSGLEAIPFATTGFSVWFANDEKKLNDEFNEFLKGYLKSPEYEDFLRRKALFDGTNDMSIYIPPTGKGRVLKVGVCEDFYPRIYRRPKTNELVGFDIEALRLFANAYDYQLEFVNGAWNQNIISIKMEKIDALAGYLAVEYQVEAYGAGIWVSDPFDISDVCFITKSSDDIKVSANVQWN